MLGALKTVARAAKAAVDYIGPIIEREYYAAQLSVSGEFDPWDASALLIKANSRGVRAREAYEHAQKHGLARLIVDVVFMPMWPEDGKPTNICINATLSGYEVLYMLGERSGKVLITRDFSVLNADERSGQ